VVLTGAASPVRGQQQPPPPTAAPSAHDEPVSPEQAEAREAAEQKEADAQRAETEVQSLDERIAALEAHINSESKRLETADDNAQAQRSRESVDQLQAELAELRAEQAAAKAQAETKREEAEAAAEKVSRLENPFSPTNMLQWLIDHGPRILGIIIGAAVLIWFARIGERRMVAILVGHKDHGSPAERENRSRTLAAVFRNVVFIIIIVGAILMVLTEIGIAIGPLLGGVAVVGLAVAFGAQSLVKDYFHGFIILMENQYSVNDVVKIGDTAGLVERITLRMTVLRDLEGIAHFVPHGEATVVSNLTHGWARAVLDVGVSYNENAEHVIEVLTEIGKELYEDPQYQPLMLGEPEILGLDSLGDSAIVIKLMVKTKPLQQWTIKRQFLLRIKRRFDEEGIEIPFPHRTVYHRFDENQRLAVIQDDAESLATAGDGRKDKSRR
jgi:small conductance mechanosensitive channel